MKKNIIIYSPPFKQSIGGIVVLHYIGYLLHKHFGHVCNTYIYNYQRKLSIKINIKNNIYNNYINIKQINKLKNFITIYPEIIEGNPLKSKKSVRLILCKLGKKCRNDIYKSWDKNDLVFHHSSFSKDTFINKMSIVYTNPIFKNLNLTRDNTCYAIRKGPKFYDKINFIHNKDSIEINNTINHRQLLELFNKCKYFYCYDPYSGLSVIAALCGCIPIIQKLDGLTEQEYLMSKSIFHYEKNLQKIPGHAYGIENLEHAKNTLNQLYEIIENYKNINYKNIKIFYNNIFDENYKENVEKYYLNKFN